MEELLKTQHEKIKCAECGSENFTISQTLPEFVCVNCKAKHEIQESQT